jgi:hypothetical protein
MYIIFSSSWLENTSYWSSASLVSYLDFGNFGCVFSPSPVYALSDRFNIAWQKICCVLLRNFCHNNLVWSFSWFIRGLTFGLLMNFMSLNPSLIWLRMVMLAWPSNTSKSLRSVVHAALHSFLVHRHVLDDLASLWILYWKPSYRRPGFPVGDKILHVSKSKYYFRLNNVY